MVDILRDIVGDIQGLVRSESLLAKAEVRNEAGKGIAAGKTLALGLACVGLGALFFMLGAAWFLALFVPLWVALFVVAGVLLIIGAISVRSGRTGFAKVDLTPHRAVAQAEENLKWAKQQTK